MKDGLLEPLVFIIFEFYLEDNMTYDSFIVKEYSSNEFFKSVHTCVGKSSFASQTKHTVEATNTDLLHS